MKQSFLLPTYLLAEVSSMKSQNEKSTSEHLYDPDNDPDLLLEYILKIRYGQQMMKIFPEDYQQYLRFNYNVPAYFKKDSGKQKS